MVKYLVLNIQKDFKKEIIDPIIESKGFKLSSITRAAIKKVADKGLSTYAIDNKLFNTFKGERYPIMLDINNRLDSNVGDSINKISRRVRISNGDKAERTIKTKVNDIIRDEVYGIFMNYNDKNIFELLYEYGDNCYLKEMDYPSSKIFMVSGDYFNDKNFLKKLKEEYSLNNVIHTISKYIMDNKINLFEYIDDELTGSLISHNELENDNHNDKYMITIKKVNGFDAISMAHKLGIPVQIMMYAVLKYLEKNPDLYELLEDVKRLNNKPVDMVVDSKIINNKTTLEDRRNEIFSILEKVDDFEKFKEYFLEKKRNQVPQELPVKIHFGKKSKFFSELIELRQFSKLNNSSWNTIFTIMKEYVEKQGKGV